MTVIALVSTKCGTFVTLNPKFEGWSYNFFQRCISKINGCFVLYILYFVFLCLFYFAFVCVYCRCVSVKSLVYESVCIGVCECECASVCVIWVCVYTDACVGVYVSMYMRVCLCFYVCVVCFVLKCVL